MDRSPIMKCSCRIQAEMAIIKAEKAATKKVHKAKKLVKLATVIELNSTKKFPKTPKVEREETSRPFNLQSGQRRALMKKESSKREASKYIV